MGHHKLHETQQRQIQSPASGMEQKHATEDGLRVLVDDMSTYDNVCYILGILKVDAIFQMWPHGC